MTSGTLREQRNVVNVTGDKEQTSGSDPTCGPNHCT